MTEKSQKVTVPTIEGAEKLQAANNLAKSAKHAFLEGRAGDAHAHATHAAKLVKDIDPEGSKALSDLADYFKGFRVADSPPAKP